MKSDDNSMKSDSLGPWIKLYTKTSHSKTFSELTFLQRSVFFQMLLMAARMEYDCIYGGHTYHLQPGQFVISLRDLAATCGKDCSLKIVRDTISKLAAAQTLTQFRAQSRAQSPSLITFINWSVYQRPLRERAQSRAHHRAQLGHTGGIQPLMNSGQNAALEGSKKVGRKERVLEKETKPSFFPTDQPAQKKEQPDQEPKHAKIDDLWQQKQARPEPGPEPSLVHSYIPKANHEGLGQLHKRMIAAAGSCKGCQFNGDYAVPGHCTAQFIWDKDRWRAISTGLPTSCLEVLAAPPGTGGER